VKVNLGVDIGGCKLKSPVMVASGTFGYGDEFADYVDPAKLGAIVTKTITRHRREGNRPPRLCETTGGVLNAIGLQNSGLDDFIASKMKRYKNFPTNLIVSVGGETNDEYAEVIKALTSFDEIAAFELNISCPNIEYRDKIIAQDQELTRRAVRAARAATDKPLIVKLSPNVCDITAIAQAAQEAGADALSLINTLLGMAIDVDARRSVMVWQVHNKVTLPIIGMGGIMNARDAIEFLLAGASAVAVGTANFVEPRTALDVLHGIEAYCAKHRITDIKELIGSLNVG
jgi:dihydroorotate dehydrogenase (NAD+) catalytic subunit